MTDLMTDYAQLLDTAMVLFFVVLESQSTAAINASNELGKPSSCV